MILTVFLPKKEKGNVGREIFRGKCTVKDIRCFSKFTFSLITGT